MEQNNFPIKFIHLTRITYDCIIDIMNMNRWTTAMLEQGLTPMAKELKNVDFTNLPLLLTHKRSRQVPQNTQYIIEWNLPIAVQIIDPEYNYKNEVM